MTTLYFLAETADLRRVAALVGPLSELPVSVHVMPTASIEFWASAKVANLGEITTIQVLRPPLSAFDLAIKRAFDICASAVGLVLLSPLLLTVSLGIQPIARSKYCFVNRQCSLQQRDHSRPLSFVP